MGSNDILDNAIAEQVRNDGSFIAPSPNLGEGRGEVKKAAFTLAEVLITLGIIGIVAALTLPTIVNNYRKKALETQFKTTLSIISQAYYSLKAEKGYSSLHDYYVVYDGSRWYLQNEFKNDFLNQLKTVTKLKPASQIQYKTYDGSRIYGASDSSYVIRKPNIVLANGAILDLYITATGSGENVIGFLTDINGAKGPNRAGYDLFTFRVENSNDKITGAKMTRLYTEEELEDVMYQGAAGNPCSKKSKQSSNGCGCTGFALENVCPDDNTKTYWECLYN